MEDVLSIARLPESSRRIAPTSHTSSSSSSPPFTLSMTTWNAAAVFCSRFAVRSATAAKLSRIHQLLRGADILCTQEAHGHDGDLSTLDREAPSHRHLGSFAPSAAAGGVLISIRNSLAERANSFEPVVLAPGWCLALRCIGPSLADQYINLHLEPALSFAAKISLLEDVATTAAAFAGTTYLMGDFNFVPSDEARFQLQESRDSVCDGRLALHFESLFSSFTELHQSCYTRKQVVHGQIVSFSKLDRIYNLASSTTSQSTLTPSATSLTPPRSATTSQLQQQSTRQAEAHPLNFG